MNDMFWEKFREMKEKCNKNNISILNLKPNVASKEYLSVMVSIYLIEDIENIIKLKRVGYPKRYLDSIIRNMSEQIIEYKYIIKHPKLIKEYFGDNLSEDLEKLDVENLTVNEMLNKLKETGEARFNGGKRLSISKMAKDIKEKKSKDNRISLYDIFSFKAELEHNSYFNSIFEEIEKVKKKEGESDLEEWFDSMFIELIIDAFLRTYNLVVV
ncbi:hypothetical protein [Clostridium saccharoperbutylacetonicum]